MNANQMIDMFVEREFEVDGIEGTLKLRLGKPQPDPRIDWYCEYQIVGVSDEKIYKAYGVDSMQALLLALNAAKALLELYARGEYKITWLGQDDFGLSMTKSSSD